MKSYKDLTTYQKGYELTLQVYRATINFPKEEIYGLVSQMKRSAVSIPCNIAEGYRRRSRKEYLQFLYVALGSCAELETLLSLAQDLKMISRNEFETIYRLQEDVSRLLHGLIASLQPKP